MIQSKSNRGESNANINNFTNTILNDLKSLTNSLRSTNKSAEINALINNLLLASDRDAINITKQMLSHLLHIVEIKNTQTIILSMLSKIISFIKIIEDREERNEDKIFQRLFYQQQMSNIMFNIIDIILLLKNKYKQSDMMLRVIQATFSLIDINLLKYVNYDLIIRIYSICFQCCLSTLIIQNISISALFALTQIIFTNGKFQDCSQIIKNFLEYIFQNKKFNWIKQIELNGMIWDLIISGIKNFSMQNLQRLKDSKEIIGLINLMYKISIQKVFTQFDEKNKQQNKKKSKKSEIEQNNNFKKGIIPDFIRFYKSFIYFSIHLSLTLPNHIPEIVPFRQNIHLFKMINDLERSNRSYLFLQGISLILVNDHKILVEQERGFILLDVMAKISEQMCLQQAVIEINWEANDLYLEKMSGDFNKITDADFVRLIKNTIIALRKKYQLRIDNINGDELATERSQSLNQVQTSSEMKLANGKKRWERTIALIIKIIRYLTSLNLKEGYNEQTVRKLISQLQYWFLICPSNKSRHLILQQLLNTSTLIDTKTQAIKVSQCVQIGTNIIYGYYDALDSLGLSLLMRMMAGVKADREEGKGFQQLDQVFMMSQKLYTEQKIVEGQQSFKKTIQAFIECANNLLADLEQLKKQQRNIKIGKSPQQRFMIMMDYVLSKLTIIVNQNSSYIINEWNLLTGFWISFCSNKSIELKNKTMNHLFETINNIFKKQQISQQFLLSAYLELAKLNNAEIFKNIINQLKQLILVIKSQEAIIEMLKIIRMIFGQKQSKTILVQLNQLQEMLIKQSMFRVKALGNLIFIIDSVSVLSQQKNQQYKLVDLIWSISDHLKQLQKRKELVESQTVWRHLFDKIYYLAYSSRHGETKQSCIHTFTQILAESSMILGVDLFVQILQKTYLELFYLSLGIGERSVKLQGPQQLEMMKVAIKNYSKVIKKCLGQNNQNAMVCLNQPIGSLTKHFKLNGDSLPLEYFYEICILIDYLKFIKTNKQIQENFNFIDIENLIKQMQNHSTHLDKQSLMWKKRYEPLLNEVKSVFC